MTDRLFWLSCVDPSLPEGSSFIGVYIARASDIDEAVATVARVLPARHLSVMGMDIDPELNPIIPETEIGRVLTREEAGRVDAIGAAYWAKQKGQLQ